MTNVGSKLVFHIFASLAEFERSLIRERAIAGLAAARARGRKGGRKIKMEKPEVHKDAEHGDTFFKDQHPDLKADYILLADDRSVFALGGLPLGVIRQYGNIPKCGKLKRA